MRIFKVWFFEYDEEGRHVIDTVEKYYSTWEKAAIAASEHKTDAWTGKAHIQEIEVE